MDDQARRVSTRQLVEAINARGLEWFDALHHDDMVVKWPSRVR